VREKYSKWQVTCLALVPADGSKKEYRKVGLVFLREDDWFGKLNNIPLHEMDESLPWKRHLLADNKYPTQVTII
jgi:hypothetical protein